MKVVRWAALLIFVMATALGVLYLVLWYGPDVLARHDVGTITGAKRATDLQQARDAARGRLLTLGAGIFAAGALIFTAQNYRVARRTVEVTEQGQVTDRYTKAIEQVGSDKLDVRIGGIYALERIAADSARDHPTVMEVLAAFIREHSREQWPLPESDDAPAPEHITRPDVQAALTVMARRDGAKDRRGVDLTGAQLARADFKSAKLAYGSLKGADLTGADLTLASLALTDLTGADLTGADLSYADLTGARLEGAHLTGAKFHYVKLIQAHLTDVDLVSVDLSHANLSGADLSGADLRRANLTWADLHSANLDGANLDGANFHGTRLDGPAPDGWMRHPGSMVLSRASEEDPRNRMR